MDNYSTPGTQETPAITFDLTKGEIEISGNSIPENPVKFFAPLVTALNEYIIAPKPITTITFKMNYINTSSSRHILDILKKLETINKNPGEVIVNWVYEHDDQDMEEAGNDYQTVVDLKFNLIPVVV